MRALFVLSPTESKRLIARAVANMEEVKEAFKDDKLVIGHGSSAGAVAEEILGKEKLAELMDRNMYVTGMIENGVLCCTVSQGKPPLLVINKGVVEPPAATVAEVLRGFGRNSVFIKGANAVDPEGNTGSLVAHPEGGTIGWAIATIMARGVHFIVPVGLEKLIPSVKNAALACGQLRLDYCQGMRVGMIPLSGARVVTEIEALRILTGVETAHVASGGSGDSQGAVTLISEGDTVAVNRAIELVESIKGEPSLQPKRATCLTCDAAFCGYRGQAQEDLPRFLRNP